MARPGDVLKKMLWDALFVRLSPLGYTRRRRDWEFRRDYPWGRAAISLTFITHPGDIDVIATIAVRHDRLEDLAQRTRDADDEAKRGSASLFADIGNIRDGRQMRWTVVGDADIEPVANRMMGMFDEVAFPFIEKYGDLGEVLGLTASDDGFAQTVCPMDALRAMTAVAAAVLVGKDKTWITQLIAAKIERLRNDSNDRLPDFLEFLDSLDDSDLHADKMLGSPALHPFPKPLAKAPPSSKPVARMDGGSAAMLCVGLVLGDVRQIGSPADEAIASIGKAVACQMDANRRQITPTISVDFHLPGSLCVRRWEGLRVMGYSRKHQVLSIGVAVPEPVLTSGRPAIGAFAIDSLREAIRLAVPVFRKNGLEFPTSDAEALVERVKAAEADSP